MTTETPTALSYCPKCGSDQFKSGSFKPWTCDACGFRLYQNTAAAAGALVINSKNQILLVRRSQNPGAGKWGIPGGFVDVGETAEQALARECQEEIGLKPKSMKYLTSFPNEYAYGGLIYDTLDVYFIVTPENLDHIKPLDEVDEISWFDIHTLDMDTIAFPSCKKAIQVLQEYEHNRH